MPELQGVLDVSVNNTPGFFYLSEETQGVLFYALSLAALYRNWLSSGTDELTDSDKAQIDDLIEFATYEVMNMAIVNPVGVIQMWLTDTIPDKWLKLVGQEISRTTYAELFALWGTTFGAGDGSTTFVLPDFRSLHPKGAGGVISLGAIAGSSVVTLTTGQLPAHSHGVTDPGHVHRERVGNGANAFILAAGGGANPTVANGTTTNTVANNTGSATTGITIDNTGSGNPISTAQPSIGVHYIVYAGV